MEIKLHKVVKGPIEVEEGWLLVCTAEFNGTVSDEEFVFDQAEEADEVVQQLTYTIDPVVYDTGEWQEVIQ